MKLKDIDKFIWKYENAAIAALEYTKYDVSKAITIVEDQKHGRQESRKMVKEKYYGCFDSREDFVRQLYEKRGNVPDSINEIGE